MDVKKVVKFSYETSESCEIKCGVPRASVLVPIVFSLFINNYILAAEGLSQNMCATDVIIYASAMSTHKLECKARSCVDSTSNWYGMNRLCTNKEKISVMVTVSKL